MSKSNYSDDPVYTSRPYHALYISDDEAEDDDVCVWPDFSDYDSIDEPLAGHFRQLEVNAKGKQSETSNEPLLRKRSTPEQAQSAKDTGTREKIESPKTSPANTAVKRARITAVPISAVGLPGDIDLNTGKLTKEEFRAREIQYALSSTRRSLTHMSQFLLKLEARAGKTTKEGIRQTLDATVQDMHCDFGTCDADHKTEIEEIKELSGELFHRLYLIDRNWRRIARELREAGETKCPNIGIKAEPDVRKWIRAEAHTNHLAAEETCFYTVHDLVANRSFSDWIFYLRDLCRFGNHPADEQKLVELAWRFLDRNLRGPRPMNPTSVRQFIGELDEKSRSGVWDEVRKNPRKQERDDADAWKILRRHWTSRKAPM